MNTALLETLRLVSLATLVPILLVFLMSVIRRESYREASVVFLEKIAFLVPLKEEVYESIRATLNSIEELNYPTELKRVYLIINLEDTDTLRAAEQALQDSWSFRARICSSSSRKRLKAADINAVLKDIPEILEENGVIAVLDADLSKVDPDQALIAVSSLRGRCVAVSPKIYTFRNDLLGYLTLVESIIWYNVVFKGLETLGSILPLTGKSIYVKSSILKELGGFPEELAEDAALTLKLAEKGFDNCYLNSFSYVLPPRDIRTLIVQRRRWSRAIAVMTIKALASSTSPRRRLSVAAPYLLSIDLSLLLLTSIPTSLFSADISGVIALTMFVCVMFYGLRLFLKRNLNVRGNNNLMLLASFLFIPYLILLMLIQLAILFRKEEAWRKTVRR